MSGTVKTCGGCDGEAVRVDGKFVHKDARDAQRCGQLEVVVLKMATADGKRPDDLGPAFYGQDVEAARASVAAGDGAFQGSIACQRCTLRHRYAATKCAGCGLDFEAYPPEHMPESQGVPEGVRPEPLDLCDPERRVLLLADGIKRSGYWRAVRAAAEGAVDAVGIGRTPEDGMKRAQWVSVWWDKTPSRGDDEKAEPQAADFFLSPHNIMAWTGSGSAYLAQPPSAMFAEAQKGRNELVAWVSQLAFAQDVADEMDTIISEREVEALQSEPTFKAHTEASE